MQKQDTLKDQWLSPCDQPGAARPGCWPRPRLWQAKVRRHPSLCRLTRGNPQLKLGSSPQQGRLDPGLPWQRVLEPAAGRATLSCPPEAAAWLGGRAAGQGRSQLLRAQAGGQDTTPGWPPATSSRREPLATPGLSLRSLAYKRWSREDG